MFNFLGGGWKTKLRGGFISWSYKRDHLPILSDHRLLWMEVFHALITPATKNTEYDRVWHSYSTFFGRGFICVIYDSEVQDWTHIVQFLLQASPLHYCIEFIILILNYTVKFLSLLSDFKMWQYFFSTDSNLSNVIDCKAFERLYTRRSWHMQHTPY